MRYHKGEANPADVLSRMPLPTSTSKQNVADEYVNFIAAHAVPKSMTIQEIEQATQSNQQFQAVITALKTGQWHPDIQLFYHSRSELTVTKTNLLLHGTCIVMPQSLCSRTLDIAHQGHQGIVKTKQLLRSKVWWPGIDKDAEKLVVYCLACQATGPACLLSPSKCPNCPLIPGVHFIWISVLRFPWEKCCSW